MLVMPLGPAQFITLLKHGGRDWNIWVSVWHVLVQYMLVSVPLAINVGLIRMPIISIGHVIKKAIQVSKSRAQAD